jgi:hypothetical protein
VIDGNSSTKRSEPVSSRERTCDCGYTHAGRCWRTDSGGTPDFVPDGIATHCPAQVFYFDDMTEVLPLLYLHGLSTSDFGPAMEQFLGSGAGLSATTITRLTAQVARRSQGLRSARSLRHRLRLCCFARVRAEKARQIP